MQDFNPIDDDFMTFNARIKENIEPSMPSSFQHQTSSMRYRSPYHTPSKHSELYPTSIRKDQSTHSYALQKEELERSKAEMELRLSQIDSQLSSYK